jgi:hypothetical protein
LRADGGAEAAQTAAKGASHLIGSIRGGPTDNGQGRTVLLKKGAVTHAGAAFGALLMDLLHSAVERICERGLER